MREKKPVSRGLVGVDEGERREQGRGRKGRGKRAKRRRSTHGRRVDREGRERAVPRKSGFEVNYRRVNRGGERRDTRANDVAKERSRVSLAKEGTGETEGTSTTLGSEWTERERAKVGIESKSDTSVCKQMTKEKLARVSSRTSVKEAVREGRNEHELVQSERINGTRRDGGRRVGWETRRVPNRYDYYLEGHRVNRASKARAKTSVASGVENRRG